MKAEQGAALYCLSMFFLCVGAANIWGRDVGMLTAGFMLLAVFVYLIWKKGQS